jgi:hypothetical protein
VAKVVRDKPRYGLRLELGDDGMWAVHADEVVIFTSRVRTAAEIEFDEAVEARSQSTREARSRELADFAVRGVLAKAGQQKAAARQAGRSRGKGG